MRRHKKSKQVRTNEILVDGYVIIMYKTPEQQFEYMNKLPRKYAKVIHVPENKCFKCTGNQVFGRYHNQRESYSEYNSRFDD